MSKKINRKSKLIHVIKRSCITGKVVWIYHGHSHEGARWAYWQACKKEVKRVRQWAARMDERRRQLMRLLTGGDSSSSGTVLDEMTPEQREAAKEILSLSKQEPPQDREFYDHIVEEARRRNWKSNRWSENRKKMIRFGKYK